jgi:hypothetical protein
VAATADADPVTRLVTGWLAAKGSANTCAAYARDIGITRRSAPAASMAFSGRAGALSLDPGAAALELRHVACLRQRGHHAPVPAAVR